MNVLIVFLASIVIYVFLVNISHADSSCRPQGTITPVPDLIWDHMQGVSWHADMGCPTRNQLSYLRIPYRDFNKRPQMGEMITARSVARDVLATFTEMYCSGEFLIEKMKLIDHYDGSDPLSMDDNNTSSFNCRLTSNGKRLSEHSFGKAIDINPVQNPYVRKGVTLPKSGHPYNTTRKRQQPHPGMITENDIVTRAFNKIAWKWGGNWRNSKDYQHFSKSGH